MSGLEEEAKEAGVNLSVVEELGGLQSPDGGDFVAHLVEVFDREAHAQLDAIDEAIERADAAQLDSAAHRLKGGAASVGAERVAEVAKVLEERAEANELDEAAATAGQLRAEVERALAILRKFSRQRA